MLEALLAATATSGLLVLARGQRQSFEEGFETTRVLIDDGNDDLPCPWCFCPTAIADERCPSCGGRFG